jgi:hypothetical protein
VDGAHALSITLGKRTGWHRSVLLILDIPIVFGLVLRPLVGYVVPISAAIIFIRAIEHWLR